ncbi:MAG: multidrug resistance protein A [bacterium]|nr:MAG: multidrug resistance protein A [bacterium]
MDKEKMKDLANSGDEAGKKQKKKSKTGSVLIAATLILLLLGAAAYWYVEKVGFVSTDDAYIDANKLNLSPQIMGRVVALYADEDDAVRKGELLVALDSSDIKARLNQAATSLNSARLGIKLAQVRLEQSRINLNRAEIQIKGDVIPRAKYDNILKAFQAAKVELEIAKSKIATLNMEIQVIKTELAHTKLYSNISGIIAKRWILTGDVVAPGQSVFTIYNLKNIWVTAMIKETDLNKISLGDTVNIQVDAYPDTKFTGRIFQIGSNTAALFSLIPPANASGNFTKITQRISVKISIKPVGKTSLKYGLLPGMSVEIKLRAKGGAGHKIW